MTIAVVQQAGVKNSGGTSNAVTLTGVSASNALLLILTTNTAPSAVPTGYTQLYAPAPSGGGARCYFYINASPSAGSNTATANFAVGAFSGASLTEISGLGASPLDVSVVNNAGVVTSISAVSGTLAQASEILLAAMTYGQPTGSANAAITDPPTGFTSIFASQNTANDQAGEHCYKIVSATTSTTATWSWTDTPITDSQATIISLKAASASAVLAGSTSAVATQGVSLAVAKALSGTLGAVATNASPLIVKNALTGSLSVVASNPATIGIASALAGTIGATATNSGPVGNALRLSGMTGAIGTLAGPLANAITLNGGSFAVGSMLGSLTSGSASVLAGPLGATASFGGNLTNSVAIAGQMAAASTDGTALSVNISLAVNTSAVGTFAGSLTSGQAAALAGSVGAVARLSGTLSNNVALAGVTGSVAADTGAVSLGISLNGIVGAVSNFSGAFGGLTHIAGQLISLQSDDRLIMVIATGNRLLRLVADDRWIHVFDDDDRQIQLTPADRAFLLKGN